jgi:hypothetical protein
MQLSISRIADIRITDKKTIYIWMYEMMTDWVEQQTMKRTKTEKY